MYVIVTRASFATVQWGEVCALAVTISLLVARATCTGEEYVFQGQRSRFRSVTEAQVLMPSILVKKSTCAVVHILHEDSSQEAIDSSGYIHYTVREDLQLKW